MLPNRLAMPAFKYKDKPLLYFGIFTDHMSLFPTGAPTEMLKDLLHDFKVSKGTIQFTLDKPIPKGTITAILTFRMSEINAK